MDRRDFMKKSMAGAGALIATSALPAFADDKQLVFQGRGRFERMSLSYATVNIGLEKPFSVLHLSDSHLTSTYDDENEWRKGQSLSRTRTFGGLQEDALVCALDWAKKHVDYIVHTGDLIDYQSEANFELVKKYFGDNMFGSLGNHEFIHKKWDNSHANEGYKDETRKRLEEVYPFDLELYSQVVNGVNFVTLDDVFGYVTKKQVKRQKRGEEGPPDRPVHACAFLHGKHLEGDLPFLEDEWAYDRWSRPASERRLHDPARGQNDQGVHSLPQEGASPKVHPRRP